MRVAGEVRKRVDEAQRDMERSAVARQGSEEDGEEDEERGGVDADRRSLRSVRAGDRELLEGAEAEVESGGRGEGGVDLLEGVDATAAVTAGSAERVVEFER